MLIRRARLVAGSALAVVRKLVEKIQASEHKERSWVKAQARIDESVLSSGLAGKRVLITGSTRGIGRALAEAFAKQGASVVIHGRRLDHASAVAAEISKGAATPVTALAADLTVPGEGRMLVQRALEVLGGLDVVINNAGIHDPTRKHFSETSSAEMHELLKVNVLAAFDVSAAALHKMLEDGTPGRIINISTGAANPANVSESGIASYGISKFALEGMASYLAAESHGVTVATLRPGTIDTDMVAPLFPLDQRWRMWPAESLIPPVLHLVNAPRSEVHGRVFEQSDLIEQLGGAPKVTADLQPTASQL